MSRRRRNKGTGIWMKLLLVAFAMTVCSLVFYNLGITEGKNSNKRKLATCLFELNQLKAKQQ